MSSQESVPCQDFVEMVTDYLEGTMDPAVRTRVDEHLSLCPGCAEYLDQMRLTIAHVGEIGDDALSPQAWSQLEAAFRAGE